MLKGEKVRAIRWSAVQKKREVRVPRKKGERRGGKGERTISVGSARGDIVRLATEEKKGEPRVLAGIGKEKKRKGLLLPTEGGPRRRQKTEKELMFPLLQRRKGKES